MERTSQPPSEPRHGVMIVDDHEVVREGLRLVIENTTDLFVCADVSSMEAAQREVFKAQPAAAVVDLSLGEGGEGLQLVKWLRSHQPALRIVVSSMHDEALYGERALRAGAHGYVSKSAPVRSVLDAIRSALAGQLYFADGAVDSMLRRTSGTARQRSPVDGLSDRELQVFRAIGNGQASKEIAATLGISVSTVDTYRERLKTKLHLKGGAELVNRATRWLIEEGRGAA